MIRRSALALCVAAALVGCAQLTHVASGNVTIKQRMVVTVDQPWNQFQRVGTDPTPTWTQEGLRVDELRFYVALKDGELIAPTPAEPKGQKPLAFKSSMQTNDILALFESLYSRGGSSFALEKVTPATFLGQPGFSFEFSSIRKSDEVRLRGVGWGTVRSGELYAITYTAPRLAFFPRGTPGVEAIAKSARLAS
jgi:hypothetical protein